MATNITHRNVGDTTTKIQDKEDTSKAKQPKSSRWKQFVVLIAFWTALVLGATWYFRRFNASVVPEGGLDLTTLNIPFKRSGGAHANDYFTLSKDDLKHYDGSDPNLPILLVVKGHIFDVSSGRNYYGPGSGYNFFCGRDGTRSFSTTKTMRNAPKTHTCIKI
jgi:predicted heme/steroid binding protein